MSTLVPLFSLAAEDPRDFSGVWQAVASEPVISHAPANGTFTQEGEVKLADFAAHYPNVVEASAYCVPAGMPATMTAIPGDPIDITQTPTRLTMITALSGENRRIYLDERDFPEDYPPSRMGYSVGHWDANTLVIETRLLSELLTGRFPRTEQTVVVERLSTMTRDQVTTPASAAISTPSIDDTILALNLTVTDPTLYAKPQVFTIYYQHIDDNAMSESNCIASLWEQALKDANP